jgi:ABC-type oligopeptide transport system substrate-binding subunit
MGREFLGIVRAVLAATLLSLIALLAACANPSATLTNVITADPAKPYLGRTKTQIIDCAGFPSASIQTDTGEVLTYRYSGAGPVPGGAKKAEKKSKKTGLFGGGVGRRSDKDWTCSASLTFQHDRLVRVRFAHKDVNSPYAYQSEKNPEKAEAMRKAKTPTCTFSLPNC